MKLVKNPQPITNIATIYSNWSHIQNQQYDSSGSPLVLNVEGNSYGPGAQVIVYQQTGTTNNELWQLAPDGHIISRITNNLVLDVGDALDSNSRKVITNSWSHSPSQIWKASGNTIINQQYPGFSLSIQSTSANPSSGDNVILTQFKNYKFINWYFTPTSPLDSILKQPAQPFPSFSGDQLDAYTYISEGVAKVPSIRDEYINLAAPLGSYQINMTQLSCPKGVSEADFVLVKNQLNNELTFAQAIILLFNNYSDFHGKLFEDNSARLNQLALDVGLEIGSTLSVAGSMISVFSGILYTILCAIPMEGINPFGIAANLIQTGINVAVAASSASSRINPDPFQVQLAKLWDQLSTNFEALLVTMGNIESTLLQDWGMMQAAYSLIVDTKGPNSLAWSAKMTGNIIQAAAPGYEIAILQMLMPAKYQIYTFNPKSTGIQAGAPDSCKWTETTGAGLLFFVADIETTSKFPTDDLMNNKIWGNGVPKWEFFQSKFGWTFPSTIIDYNDSRHVFANATCTVSNNTPYQLSFYVIFNKDKFYYSLDLYGSDIGPKLNDNYSIVVYDPYGKQIASFDVVVDSEIMEGCYVSIKNVKVSSGYLMSSPLCNQGSFHDCYTAAANISITLDNSN